MSASSLPARTAEGEGGPASFRALPRLRVRWRRARRRTTWRDFARLGVVFLGLGACGVAYHSSGVVFNHTASMPMGFYQVRRAAPAVTRGAVVVWCLPTSLVAEAKRRGYLGGGSCPGGVESILKEVAAVPGDTVVVDPAGLAVNGRRLAGSRPLARDSRGRPVASVPHGRYVVRPGEAWLWSPHTAHSFDSRYYGALPVAGLVGVARPLWTRDLPYLPSGGGGVRRPAASAAGGGGP